MLKSADNSTCLHRRPVSPTLTTSPYINVIIAPDQTSPAHPPPLTSSTSSSQTIRYLSITLTIHLAHRPRHTKDNKDGHRQETEWRPYSRATIPSVPALAVLPTSTSELPRPASLVKLCAMNSLSLSTPSRTQRRGRRVQYLPLPHALTDLFAGL